MATLQKIRNRAGVLVAVIIGMALFAFILGDLLNSGPSVFQRGRLEVAEIDGQSINYMEYNAKIEELAEFYRSNYQMSSLDQETLESIREEVWRTTVQDIVLGNRFNDLGINVSAEELKTMLLGDSISTGGTNIIMDEPHPMVRRMFTNPETGEFNRFQMMNYFNAISNEMYQDERKRWIYVENQIVDERKSQKYFTMVQKGMQPNSLDARNYAIESSSTVSFDFVSLNFNTVTDDEISFTEAELKKYYEDHKNEYRQDESRSVEYVIFPIEPSTEDEQNAEEFIEQSKVPFQRTENPISFVNSNSDLPYQDVNYSPEDLPQPWADSLFNADPGYVAGPYFENNTYKIARLIDFVMVPDSVRARHILISLSVQRDDDRAEAIADSLLTVIENGADFNTLARDFSADQSNSQIGGDLGWFTEGTMVKAFNDFCFNNETGDMGVVKTNFGYHVIKIEAQSAKEKKAKLAIVQREVVPSDATYQDIYSRAVEFRSEATNLEKFRNQYNEKGLSPRFASDFQKNSKELPGLENSREIIRWSFENEEGSVSQIFDLSDKYIVAALTDVKEKGFADFESVRNEIEIAVSKQKKLQKVLKDAQAKLDGVNDITAAADALNAQTQQAEKVRLSNPYVNPVGLEPAVAARAMNLETGEVSEPFIGENAVFIVQVTEKDIPEDPDLESARFRMKYTMESRVMYQGYEALRKRADIEDNRINFY
jgi:peptidyl-prolyl cis-trans isomerase D